MTFYVLFWKFDCNFAGIEMPVSTGKGTFVRAMEDLIIWGYEGIWYEDIIHEPNGRLCALMFVIL